MAKWFDDEYWSAADRYREAFPDSDWGVEGCGLEADEAIALMNQSSESGVDHLSASYPDYPEGVEVA